MWPQVTRRDLLKGLVAASTAAMCDRLSADDKKRGGAAEHKLPVTGIHHPELAPFDELMTEFVEKHNVPGASLTVSRHSRIVYARGFGWADVEARHPVHPDTLFRIASISKPITAVALLQLAAAGKFELKQHLFDILPAQEWLPEHHDPRIRKITILQLLQHTSGWDWDKLPDPIGIPHEVAKALNKPLPVSPADVIRYTLSLKLQHNPGERYAYLNVGYLMLGRLIEHVSGQHYEAYVKEHVLKPVGISHMQLGHAWVGALAKNETHYYDSKHRVWPAVRGPHLGAKVPIVYGGENLEGFEAHGGWIASGIDLVKFASDFDRPESSKLLPARWINTMWGRPAGLAGHEPDGKPSPTFYGCGWQLRPVGEQGKFNAWHMGWIAGTSTLLVRRSDGLNWAVLFNTGEDAHDKTMADLIDPLVHQAADAVTKWPDKAVVE